MANEAQTATNPDLSPLWDSVGRCHGWTPARVEGQLPAELQATVLRVGPGLMERFGRRLAHSFEADGAMIGVRLPGDGTAQGAVRLVEGPGYKREQAAGRPLFGSAAPWWRRFLNGLQQRTKATGNTAVLHWQGRTFALMEGARPLEIDVDELRAGELVDFGGVLGPAFTAHPHRVESLSTTFAFGMRYGPRPALDLYALPDRGAARSLGHVPLPWNAMVHDFAVTDRHLVFIVCPSKVRIGRAMLAPRDMASLFEWDPSAGAQLLVVPLDAIDEPVRTSIDARFVFHFANAQERGNELLVDFVQHPDDSVIKALSGEGNSRTKPPRLQRLVLDPKSGRVHSDQSLWDLQCEFPVLPAGRVGHRYETLWLQTGDQSIARFEPETGALDTWQPGPGYSPSEPLFVPRPNADRDDQGWLVSLVLDGWRGESFFGVFDADHPSTGPIARVWMGQPLPTTFHGTVIPNHVGMESAVLEA